MKQNNKIYLSLDDLNKLYGISPSVLKAIKSKRKKRKLKRNKLNNKNMDNNKSDSKHMVISSNLLANETQRLNATNIQNHIDNINKNNKLLTENNKPKDDNNKPKDKNFEQINNIIDGINSGKINVSTNNNSIKLTNKDLNKKPGRPKNSDKVEFLGEIQSNIKVSNPLTNVKTNLMKNKTNNVIAVDFDDTYGNISYGTSSDNFFISDNFDEDISDIPKVEEIIDPETVDEPKLGLEKIENNEQSIEDYNMKELKQFAQAYGIKKKFKTKQDLFDCLKENNIRIRYT
jgi:hypothetical protein